MVRSNGLLIIFLYDLIVFIIIIYIWLVKYIMQGNVFFTYDYAYLHKSKQYNTHLVTNHDGLSCGRS